MVFDCLVLDRELLTQKTFDKRIGRFQQFVQKPLHGLYKKFPQEREFFPFEVLMKGMDKPYALEDMFTQKLPNLPHGNDGLVFTAKNAFYTSGTDEMILKWKPANENSIDFKLQLGEFPMFLLHADEGQMVEDWDAKPAFHLLVKCGNGDYRQYADLFVTAGEWEAMKALGEQLDGRIIECYLDDYGRWRFKKEAKGTPRFREDKPEANHISTVHKVIESIQDGVTEEELRAAALSIQRAWKARHPEEDRARRPGPPQNGHA
jgi:mRNA guanylyltransferase